MKAWFNINNSILLLDEGMFNVNNSILHLDEGMF